MTDEQLQRFQEVFDAVRAAWDAIVQIARETVQGIIRWWRSPPRSFWRAIVPHPPTIMRRKIRRYARMNQ